MPDRSPDNVRGLVNGFFGGMLTFDLALQWTLLPGPFRYDFKWLTGKTDNAEVVAFAKQKFHDIYGVDIEKCEIIG